MTRSNERTAAGAGFCFFGSPTSSTKAGKLVFDRIVTKKTPGEFRTRVIQDGVHPSLHIDYKNFDLKPYFKEGRGCRTEGTFRNPTEFGINKGLANLPDYLQKIGREINRRLLQSNASATTAA
jgi:hypothetical protein